MTIVKPALGVLLLLICSGTNADVYVLGSSYSANALPYALDDRPQWHIDCGRPLQFIYDNPQAPCDSTSTIWPVALLATQFDHISFQPVAGTGITEQSDLDTIGYWMSLQPTAVVVIHPTWPVPAIWESAFHNPNPDNTLTNYSQQYYYDLISKLQTAHPRRTIATDRANEMLDSIYHDIQNGIGLLENFQEMFADSSGHSSFNYGKYLQHNALRQAFGQQTGVDNTSYGVDPKFKSYLDEKVRACQPLAALPLAEDPCFATSFAAVKDAFTVTQNRLTDPLNVLANDIGVGNPVTVTVETPPDYGTATPIPTGPADPAVIRIKYMPTPGYSGPDSFVYKIENGTRESYGRVQMTILPDLDGDADDDLVPDTQDNCTLAPNPSQLDADGDGYGNACDADLNNSGFVTTADFALMRSVLGQSATASPLAAAADMNGSGTVTVADFAILRSLLGKPPGPSGLHPNCPPTCP
jgi:Bacterial Ig domain/Dockerin type I domain/Thrombospondin type 3 repeat